MDEFTKLLEENPFDNIRRKYLANHLKKACYSWGFSMEEIHSWLHNGVIKKTAADRGYV